MSARNVAVVGFAHAPHVRRTDGTTNGQATGNSISTTVQSPSLFNQLMAAGDFASRFIPFPGA